MELTQEDLILLLSVLENVSIKGTEGMKRLIELSEKLEKGIEEPKE